MRVFRRGIAVLCTIACLTGMTPATTYALTSGTTQNSQAATTTQASTTTQTTATTTKIVTPISSIQKKTNVNQIAVKIKSATGYRIYKIYNQKKKSLSRTSYLFLHGCATSALTTVLSAYSAQYTNILPAQTYTTLEKKILGLASWKENYSKVKYQRMPISLNGISTILTKLGIKNTYISTFTNSAAVKQIKTHLYTGNPVVIIVNNHVQNNGRFSSKFNRKWTNSKHTMVLLGMTETGKVIIADSSYRAWSKTQQRIKYATVEEIVKFMIPSKRLDKKYYYRNNNVSGGYVLVNPQ